MSDSIRFRVDGAPLDVYADVPSMHANAIFVVTGARERSAPLTTKRTLQATKT